jgi:hypothetical protein
MMGEVECHAVLLPAAGGNVNPPIAPAKPVEHDPCPFVQCHPAGKGEMGTANANAHLSRSRRSVPIQIDDVLYK